jgi:LVIVD repeat-containing protein
MKTLRGRLILTCAALALGLAALLGHRWLALGWNAWHYPAAARSARTRAVVEGGRAYLAAGAEGIEVIDLATKERRTLLPPDAPADRIDDLALADGWLFALDATPPGYLMIYSLANPDRPSRTGNVVTVPVGPFSGVSAAAGVVIVSGGTSQLTLREYDRQGQLGNEVATADFGRGQPDVALRPDGRIAAISTHIVGPDFALTFAGIQRQPLSLRSLSQIPLKDAGFTAGGYKPAHFPLVAAWRGDRVYLAEGGGLDVIDVSNPDQPRLLQRDRRPQPAMDVALSGDELDVLRAGSQPAVLRYRLDGSGLPSPAGLWSFPAGSRPAAIARHGADVLITRLAGGWQTVPPSGFSPSFSHQP